MELIDYKISGSWTNGIITDTYFTGTYRQALLKCRRITKWMLEQHNSMDGSCYIFLNNKVVAGYQYSDDFGYQHRKIKRCSKDHIEQYNQYL